MNWFTTLIPAPYRIAIMAALALLALGGGIKIGLYIGNAEKVHALSQQAKSLKEQCDKDKAITKEANDDLQGKLNAINAKRNSERLQGSFCVPLTKPSINSPSGAKHARQAGIELQWLYDYAAECEEYRSDVIVLQEFQDKVWKDNGQ